MYAPFVISGILWHEIGEKVAFTNTVRLKDVLNNQLQISNYGAGLTGISFIYIVTQADDDMHQEGFTYRAKKKELHVKAKLPYAQVEAASLPEVLHLMAEKYVQTMQKYLPKKRIPDFDWKRFVGDVKAVFEKEGVLEGVAAA